MIIIFINFPINTTQLDFGGASGDKQLGKLPLSSHNGQGKLAIRQSVKLQE